MTPKKKQVEENSDKIEWLKKIYAEWKERQFPNELFEIKEHIATEPKDLNFDGRW